MAHPIRTFALTLSLTTCLVAPAAADTTRVLMNCFFPPQHFMCRQILPEWKRAVEEATEKRVRVSFPAQSVAPAPEQLAAVRSGTVDAALQMNGFMGNEGIGARVAMTPFSGSSDARANSVALWRTHERFLADKDPLDGVTVLGLIAAPGADFYSTTDVPIDSLDAVLERKMWALPGVTSSLLKTNGGSVVSGPAIQMTEIVQRGVVDGFVGIPAAESVAFNVLPYAKSVTRTGPKIFTAVFTVFVGDATWERISEADRAAIMEVSGEAFAELAGGIWGEVEAGVLEQMASEVDVLAASEEFETDLIDASGPFVDEWIAAADAIGIDGRAALDFYLAEQARLAAEPK